MESLAPEKRTEKLSKLEWTVVPAPTGGAILPDCVAIATLADGKVQSLVLSDLDEIETVFMPLSSDKILFGRRSDLSTTVVSSFNHGAANCSQSLFVSARDCEDFRNLSRFIGWRSGQFVDEVVSSSVDGFLKSGQNIESRASINSEEGVDEIHGHEATLRNLLPTKDFSYSVSFYDCADNQAAERISHALTAIVAEVHQLIPIDCLGGCTFSADFCFSLADLDRGIENIRATISAGELYQTGQVRTFIIRRGDEVRWRLFVHNDIGHSLIADDEERQKRSIHALVGQLALVGFFQSIEDAFPGALLRPFGGGLEAYMYPCAHGAWSSYFAARASSGSGSFMSDEYCQALSEALAAMHAAIISSRLAYRFDGNLDAFLLIAISKIGEVLVLAGKALGHFDGIGGRLLADASIRSELEKIGLYEWMAMFGSELSELWSRRHQWESFSEFTAFSRHTERLLWQYGVILWETPDGAVRVEVPLGTDAELLSEINQYPAGEGSSPKP